VEPCGAGVLFNKVFRPVDFEESLLEGGPLEGLAACGNNRQDEKFRLID
jgi:hypothetical protein